MSRAFLAAILLATACGGDDSSSTTADARVFDSTPTDTTPSACDYTEKSDATNDDVSTASGVPEATDISAPMGVLCGAFDSGHWDEDITVDVDSYTITAAADTDLLVRLAGTNLASIELVGVDIYPMGSTTPVATMNFYGNHGVTSAHLAAGTYTITVFALGQDNIPVTLPYVIELSADDPTTRCPSLASASYTESGDGGNSTGNDMITLASGTPPALSSADDAPEGTNIVLATGVSFRIDGTAANVSQADLYEDKDTYAIATAAGTNELTVRLDWTTAGANLDWILFEDNNPDPVLRATDTATTGPELRLAALKPSTSYWLLVGAKAGTTVPAMYSATLCGTQYTPPSP